MAAQACANGIARLQGDFLSRSISARPSYQITTRKPIRFIETTNVSTAEQRRAAAQGASELSGADILIEALIRQRVECIFAYPGGASMPLHQALIRQEDRLRTILPRHEQGGGFAAQGYARSSGRVGVCMATSGPGATNLVTTLADAKLDSVPIVAITGQVPKQVIGTDAFQETPIVEVCRAVTKHHYLITEFHDIARVVKEAFYVARTGRPGPVLIDFPKNIQQMTLDAPPDYDPPMNLPGYHPEILQSQSEQISQVIAAIRRSPRPVLYVGGGCINSGASDALATLARRTGIPVTTTLMGLGAFPGNDPQSLGMLGMHGTVYSNYAVNEADLLLALGVRFDDRVTGKLEEFARHGKIVHVDIDASEIHKNKEAHIPIVADVGEVLEKVNAGLTDEDVPRIDEWQQQIAKWKDAHPLVYRDEETWISPQYAIRELARQTADRDTCIAVGVGQHQMWAAQHFPFGKPRRWMSSSGLGTMGFGLPAAMGAQAANPDALCLDIDGDGSLLMNLQELATLHCEKLPVKILLLNNQHLGMVMQWEDRFFEGRRAHTWLGPIDAPEASGSGDGQIGRTYPDFVSIAQGFSIEAAQVRERAEFSDALATMLACDGPYLLDCVCPYQEHVLPMIPSGHSVQDIITE
ncbi:MAG: acetolactate synthase, large subunit, biosynthetic type [Planctomycetaceae bacterium]|nr:acetolactate synthase, large subunit, biosynthetic type [Planctomycetaceae bacterium]